MSIVSSTSTTVIEKSSIPAGRDKSFDASCSLPACTRIINAVDSSKKLSVVGHIAYGFVAYSTAYLPIGPCYFKLNNPGNITLLSEWLIPNFLSGGTWTNDGRWLCCYWGVWSYI
jgi:hypothetical protein